MTKMNIKEYIGVRIEDCIRGFISVTVARSKIRGYLDAANEITHYDYVDTFESIYDKAMTELNNI